MTSLLFYIVQKEHLGTFAEEEHGKLYVVDKKADGYPQAVLQRMYALYEEGSEAHGHMLAALPDAKTLIARLDSILGRGYSKSKLCSEIAFG